MKKYLLLFLLIPTLVFAESFIFLVNKVDSSVKEIRPYTNKNETILNNIAGEDYDVVIKDLTEAQLNYIYKKYNGTDIVIDQDKIDLDEAFKKDINNLSKLEKCGFLVIMDYFRSLGLEKTNGDFKDDVITKYDS